MIKICGTVIFSALWFILPAGPSFCQSPDDTSPAHVISSDGPWEQVNQFERGLDLDLLPEGFGPHRYSRDMIATRFAKKNIRHISRYPMTAQATTAAPEDKAPSDMAIGTSSQPAEAEEDFRDPFAAEVRAEKIPTISDPFENINRAFFAFNDRLYFWLLRPVGIGYGKIVPQPIRIGVRSFFDNLGFPVRFVNCLLQGKFDGAGVEAQRFLINSISSLGFKDMAADDMGIEEYDEDFGQTLQFWGLGPGFYLNIPIIGASSLTDSVGIVGDIYAQPLNYVIESNYNLALRTCDIVNSTSLTIGEYEDLKRASLDPYVAVRDAYYQYRLNKIKE